MPRDYDDGRVHEKLDTHTAMLADINSIVRENQKRLGKVKISTALNTEFIKGHKTYHRDMATKALTLIGIIAAVVTAAANIAFNWLYN